MATPVPASSPPLPSSPSRSRRPALPPSVRLLPDEVLPGLLGRSDAMYDLAEAVVAIARLDLPVVVLGESGTGKELVARALHTLSPRVARPFVALNASAISPQLATTELFGHRRGAFTGAMDEREGALREAHTGTLLLDELGSLPDTVQPQLLRALEEREVRPVGGGKAFPADVRVVGATCEPLEQMVAAKRFRRDLFERLAVCVVRVPPLRERLSDLPLLCRDALWRAGLGHVRVTATALRRIAEEPLTGNVRELRNLLVQAAVRTERGVIEMEDVEYALAARSVGVWRKRAITAHEALACFEANGGNLSLTARETHVARTTLRRLVRRVRSGKQAEWGRPL